MEEKRNYHEPCSCNNSQSSPMPAPQKPCGVCRGSDGSCSCLPPKVVPVQADGCPILFRRVEIPASVGDETTDPPVAGKYRNVLLVYEATGSAFLYSSDGIPTQLPQKGDKGDQGEPGPAGPVGPAGPAGPQGEAGPQGIQGEQGPQGPKGEDGAGIEVTGSVPTYADLPSGLTTEDEGKGYYVEADGKLYIWNGTSFPANGDGVQIQGPQGPQGVQGIQGPQGEQGIQGPAGADGADGISPTATVVRTQNGATITITDVQGTTTADVYDGSIANIPIASSEVLGAIKVGSNLSITADGVLSADAQQVTLYSSTGQNTDGAMTQKATTDALALKADSSSLATVATSGSYTDLSNKPIIPMVPTQTSAFANDGSDGTSVYIEADELAAVATSGNYNDLANKPTIPDAQVNSDWNADSGVAQILNKPVLATVATSGSYTDLINLPTIPATNNINAADWNALWQ